MINNKKLKTVLKLGGTLIVILAALGYLKYKDTHYTKDNSQEAINEQEDKRIASIENYDVKNTDSNNINVVDEDPADNIDSANGTTIKLDNRSDFLSFFSNNSKENDTSSSNSNTSSNGILDKGIAIANNFIPSSIKYLNIISRDCNKDNMDQYFNKNQDTILKTFGIDNEEDFSDLVNKAKSVGTITSVTINKDSITMGNGGIDFTATLKGEEGNADISVSSMVDTSTMKASFYIK